MQWTTEEINILKNQYGNIPTTAINLPNRSRRAIINKAWLLGLDGHCQYFTSLSNKKIKRKYFFNDNYFNIPSIDNCYWAGFIAADGCILNDYPRLLLTLSRVDKLHIIKFCQIIQYTGKPKDTEVIVQNKQYLQSRLVISGCEQIVKDLQYNFAITNNKSLSLIPPVLSESDFVRNFIRGYFDGDGGIAFYKSKSLKYPYWSISFCGTFEYMIWIKKTLKTNLNIGNPKINNNGNIFSLIFNGKQTLDILNWLYQDTNINIRLDRKYHKYLELKKHYAL